MKTKAKAARVPSPKAKRVPSPRAHAPHHRTAKAEAKPHSPDVIISDTELDKVIKNVGKLGAPKKRWSTEKLPTDTEGDEKDKTEHARKFKF